MQCILKPYNIRPLARKNPLLYRLRQTGDLSQVSNTSCLCRAACHMTFDALGTHQSHVMFTNESGLLPLSSLIHSVFCPFIPYQVTGWWGFSLTSMVLAHKNTTGLCVRAWCKYCHKQKNNNNQTICYYVSHITVVRCGLAVSGTVKVYEYSQTNDWPSKAVSVAWFVKLVGK